MNNENLINTIYNIENTFHLGLTLHYRNPSQCGAFYGTTNTLEKFQPNLLYLVGMTVVMEVCSGKYVHE